MASMRRHYGGWGHVVRKDLWGRHILPEGDKKSSQIGCYALGSKSRKKEKSEVLCPRICVSRIRKVSKINVYPIVKSTVKGQRSKGGSGDQGLLLPWSMRLDVLKFSGDDLDRWILAIMEYFSLLNTSADQRLRILLVSRPTTLCDAFSLIRIIKSRFEAIAEKEQNIKEKVDTTLSFPIEEVSPVVKGPLDASEDTLYMFAKPIDEVCDKFAKFFEDKGSVEKVLSATKLPKGRNSHSTYSPYHLEDKVNFEGVRNVTPWAAEVERRKRVMCYVQGSGRWKKKKGYWSRQRKAVRNGLG
ncbi:hypothetical protein Tco_1244064 [Tanacetum coccineum]